MFRRRDLFLLSVVVILVAACNPPPGSKSRFLSSFSAKDSIKKVYDPANTEEGFRVTGGETSTVLGGRRSYHRSDDADVNISQSDESSFLQRVQSEMERQLQGAGCKISERGTENGHYSLGYTDGTIFGWLDLWGVRRMGDQYRVVITITENQ